MLATQAIMLYNVLHKYAPAGSHSWCAYGTHFATEPACGDSKAEGGCSDELILQLVLEQC